MDAVIPQLALSVALVLGSHAAAVPSDGLRFEDDGHFKVLQFTDIHNSKTMDPRTTAAMGKLIDAEHPDLVVLTGDNVATGGVKTREELKESIRLLSLPMSTRKVHWAMVYGNHDTDNLSKIGVSKEEMLAMYRALPFNVNPPTAKGTYGGGNALLQVIASHTSKPAFGIWLIDSNAYVSQTTNGSAIDGYDWIRTGTIAWYYNTSIELEKKLGAKLPAIMFFHICLPEFAAAFDKGGAAGERNEHESPSNINSGMFAALLDRGDVLGVYVGHDHTNTYDAPYYGIRLGFGGSIGFAAYGLKGTEEQKQSIRGGRVFDINESDPKHYESHYVPVNSLP